MVSFSFVALSFVGVVSLVSGQRDYSITFHTANKDGCQSEDTPNFLFRNANGDDTISKPLSPTVYNADEESTFTDVDIGEIEELYIWTTSGETDAWCFDEFYFDLEESSNPEDPIKRGCSMVFQSYQVVDYECGYGDTGALKQVTLNVSSSSPICWNIYNDSLTNKTETPYYQEPGYEFVESYLDTSVSRSYIVEFMTSDVTSDCGSEAQIGVTFHSNCSFHTSGGFANPGGIEMYCNGDTVISTAAMTFTAGAAGTTSLVGFSRDDIGDITYMTLSTSSIDGWCLAKFNVLLELKQNDTIGDKWVECDMEAFMSRGIGMDDDCSENTGYKEYTLRVDEFAPYCTVFYKNTEPPTSSPTDSVCDLEYDDVIVSWDDLYSDASEVNWTSSISLTQGTNNVTGTFEVAVTVESKYLVGATFEPFADYYEGVTENDYLGVTYVLDTNEFLSEGRFLADANTCENRVSSSFDSKDFLTEYWDYSLSPSLGDRLGNDLYLEYGDQNIWDIGMSSSVADYCGNVQWTNTFSFMQLWNDCKDSNGDGSFELIETEDTISLNLNFYLTLVSPNPLYLELCDSGATDCGHYLVKTLISHPLSIVFSKQQTLISNKDDVFIDLFTSNVVGATFVEESLESNTSAKFVLTLITSVPYYMSLNVDSALVLSPTASELVTNNGDLDFIKTYSIDEQSASYLHANHCLILTDYRCFQKWDITIEIDECPAESGLLFDGSYFFSADFNCIEDDETVCEDYLSDEPLSVTLDNVNLEYTELCDSTLYEIDWNGDISFYTDESFNVSQSEFEFGDTVYTRVSISDDISNYEIFGMSIVQCYVCTSNISDASSDVLESCVDATGVVDTSLFYQMPDDTDLEFSNIDSDISDTIEDFSFVLPPLADDTFYVDCTVQLEVNNVINSRRNRQRLLLQASSSNGNVFQSFVGTGIVTESSITDDENDNNNGENNSSEDELPTFYLILIFCGAVVVVLLAVIGGLVYYMKSGKSRSEKLMMKKALDMDNNVPTLSNTGTAAASVESAV